MSDEALVLDAGVEYPTSDGRPVAETPLHYQRLADAAHALNMRFESQPGVYVGVNMLVYDQQGNPRRHLSPDLFVAFDVEDRERDIYKLWEDRSPSFVLELTSKSTRGEDERKKARYSRWGVAEYFLYDPRREYVKPPLQGFELVGGRYRAMATDVLPNGKRGFTSKTVGLGLWLDGSVLRFYDAETGRNFETLGEAIAGRREDGTRLREYETRLREYETRLREYETRIRENETLLGDVETKQATAETKQATAETKQREAETKQREAETELAAIKARFGIP